MATTHHGQLNPGQLKDDTDEIFTFATTPGKVGREQLLFVGGVFLIEKLSEERKSDCQDDR